MMNTDATNSSDEMGQVERRDQSKDKGERDFVVGGGEKEQHIMEEEEEEQEEEEQEEQEETVHQRRNPIRHRGLPSLPRMEALFWNEEASSNNSNSNGNSPGYAGRMKLDRLTLGPNAEASTRIYQIDNFLTTKELERLDLIISQNQPKFATSRSYTDDSKGRHIVSKHRTSTFTYLQKFGDEIIRRIEQRGAEVTGLPVENIEPLQIVSYRTNQHFDIHHDLGPLYSDGSVAPIQGNRRLVTIFIYLNTVPEEYDGCTEFPRLDLKVNPEKGKAIVFSNVQADGTPDPYVVHKANPVLGNFRKYGMNMWICDESKMAYVNYSAGVTLDTSKKMPTKEECELTTLAKQFSDHINENYASSSSSSSSSASSPPSISTSKNSNGENNSNSNSNSNIYSNSKGISNSTGENSNSNSNSSNNNINSNNNTNSNSNTNSSSSNNTSNGKSKKRGRNNVATKTRTNAETAGAKEYHAAAEGGNDDNEGVDGGHECVDEHEQHAKETVAKQERKQKQNAAQSKNQKAKAKPKPTATNVKNRANGNNAGGASSSTKRRKR